MKSWGELFNVTDEAIVGSPDPFRSADKGLRTFLEELQVVIDGLASEWGEAAGFEGLAAASFGALTDELAGQVRGVPGPAESVANCMAAHADELDELIADAAVELVTANDRYDRVLKLDEQLSDLRAEMSTGGPSAIEVGAEVSINEREQERARDSLERSRRAYERLRQDEENLNERTAQTLGANPLPSWNEWEIGTSDPGLAALLDGPGPSWLIIRQVFVDAGMDVFLPDGTGDGVENRGEGCQWVHNGRVHINVGGKRGGIFVVGVDISQSVYAAIAVIMSGHLPPFRTWSSVEDLSEEEFSALNWAMSTNFGVGEIGQTQMTGTNGAWQNYLEGGDWTPQPIHTMDGFELASELGGGGDFVGLAIDAAEPYRDQQSCSD